MSKFRFGYFMAMWAIAESEKRKQEECHANAKKAKKICKEFISKMSLNL